MKLLPAHDHYEEQDLKTPASQTTCQVPDEEEKKEVCVENSGLLANNMNELDGEQEMRSQSDFLRLTAGSTDD